MIKIFESFKEIEDLCEKYNIRNYTINDDLSIDVDDHVDLVSKLVKSLPLEFNKISGDFNCGHNRLTSLQGAPKKVGGNFWCQDNSLTSLEGAPQEIGDGFYCHFNKLTSLEGATRKINGNLWCQDNKIYTFDGAPDYINGNFSCRDNPIWTIWLLFQDYSKVEFFNDCDPIREIDGKPAIILERLNDFLEEIKQPLVKNVNGYINI